MIASARCCPWFTARLRTQHRPTGIPGPVRSRTPLALRSSATRNRIGRPGRFLPGPFAWQAVRHVGPDFDQCPHLAQEDGGPGPARHPGRRRSVAPTAAEFDGEFATVSGSPGLRRVWQEASPDLPPEIEPYSFVSVALLGHVADALALSSGKTLVDLGCGGGGPGLWLAQSHGTILIGVDFSAVAVQQATDRAALFGLANQARFVVGDFAGTGLVEGAADAVVSIDALQFAADPTAAAREARRLLRPGGRLVLTSWQARAPVTRNCRAACGSTGPRRWARRALPRCGWSLGLSGTTCSPGYSRSPWISGIQARTSGSPRCRTRHARHSLRRILLIGLLPRRLVPIANLQLTAVGSEGNAPAPKPRICWLAGADQRHL